MNPLEPFDSLPLRERLFVRARLASAPLQVLADRAPAGRVVDIGCGHGLLSSLLLARGDREVVGIDPDPRKIDWAKKSVGQLPKTRFAVATIQTLAEERGRPFDAAVVADVLYLLPREQWRPFLTATRAVLAPGGSLILKEAENDGSWRYLKCLWQERAMVRLLRRTSSSGGLGFAPRDELVREVEAAGFQVQTVEPLGQGYTTPHVLVVARCA